MDAEKTQRKPQLEDKYVLRLPEGMRERIAELARANSRSMNAEIIARLQSSLAARPPLTDEDVDRIAARLAEKLKTK
jgi:hypothetical protein